LGIHSTDNIRTPERKLGIPPSLANIVEARKIKTIFSLIE
jgi:hypothetical protein